MGLGGRGRRSGSLEFVADDGPGRLVSVTGEVGGGVLGVSGTVAGALVSWPGVRAMCAGVGFGAIIGRFCSRHVGVGCALGLAGVVGCGAVGSSGAGLALLRCPVLVLLPM